MLRRQWLGSAALLLLVLFISLLHPDCLASGEEPETFIVKYQDRQRAQVVSRVRDRGYTLLREYRDFNRLVILAKTPTPTPQDSGNSSSTGSTAARLTPQELAAQAAELQGLTDVVSVQYNRHLSVLPFVTSASTAAGQPAENAAADNSIHDQPATCPVRPAGNPDIDLGRNEEGVPYGVRWIQANLLDVRMLARRHADKVLYCVIDNGMDSTHPEFSRQATSGCIPGHLDGNTSQAARSCYDWSQPADDHGTHVSGIIAAMRNNRGVVGVSPQRARLYHYKIQDGATFAADTQVAAWQECIAELDRQKASSRVPTMKLVIIMSYGAQVLPENASSVPGVLAETMDQFEKEALELISKQRNDVMFFAAAGDAGPATSFVPAALDHVISVGSINSGRQISATSSTNQHVDLTAPGVNILSTVPVGSANASRYQEQGLRHLIITQPNIPAMNTNPDLFYRPMREVPLGAARDNVAAEVVDCGLGDTTCAEAINKVCLIERGGNTTLCQKVNNCAAGGGLAVIFYNSAQYPICEPMTGTSLIDADGGCSCVVNQERGLCMTTVALARSQGLALRDALASGFTFTVLLTFPEVLQQRGLSLAIHSGTSMACPAAAAVAGVVWGAHTDCTASEIRNALLKSALQPAANAAVEQRNDEYGYGVVQGLAAHQYLLKNPCVGNRNLKGGVAAAGAATQRVGASTTVSVKLVDATTGQPVVGKLLLVSSQPSRKFVSCSDVYLRTDTRGSASTTCKFIKPGNVRVVFTTSKGPGTLMHQSATNFTVVAG